MARGSFVIRPQGPFSLRESALFGFGQRHDETFDGVMRLAFCVDGGFRHQVGVELRQDVDQDGPVHATVDGEADLALVERQVARVLSLDHDARAFVEVGRRDPVIRRLQLAAPGLRPPLFYSPYEAAAWAVISARRPARQMAEVRRRLSDAYGRVFPLAGKVVAAFPTPEQLLEVSAFPGLTEEKVARLHGVAQAALDGQLEADRLCQLGPERAAADVQGIKGIGAFYSALIVIRATGFTDVLPTQEPRALELIQELYYLDGPPSPAQLAEISEPWRPFRTWATVLIRAAASRLQSVPALPTARPA
jgi:DNA-3-methyladenine glycosylase II